MITVRSSTYPLPHLYSENTRIAKESATFEIKTEGMVGEGTKYGSRYEIYNSTTKPFGRSYRELTGSSRSALSSSTISTSTSDTSSSCSGSATGSINSCYSESTTTYVTCTSELESIQMTGFHIQEPIPNGVITISSEIMPLTMDDDARNEFEKKEPEKAEQKHETSSDFKKIDGIKKEIATINSGAKSTNIPENSVVSADGKAKTSEEKVVTESSEIGTENRHSIVKIGSWPCREKFSEPLKSPKLLRQMIDKYERKKLSYELPESSTRTTFEEEEYTYEPSRGQNSHKIVTRCRSMLNLEYPNEIAQNFQSKSELDLSKSEENNEIQPPKKSVGVILEKPKSLTVSESFKKQMNDLFARRCQKNYENAIEKIVIEPKSSCRVTGEIRKNDLNFSSQYRDLCTLPRTPKTHKPQLQRHFYYHMSQSKPSLKEDELPDPDKVRSARELFEQVLKLRPYENVPGEVGKKSDVIKSPTFNEQVAEKRKKLQRGAAIIEEDTAKWTDSHSMSSGVGSDISCETDNVSESSQKDETMFSSEDEAEKFGQPVSKEVLQKLRDCGTSVTYYGGKIVNTTEGCNPMRHAMMDEIKRDRPQARSKFEVAKCNNAGTEAEIKPTTVYEPKNETQTHDKSSAYSEADIHTSRLWVQSDYTYHRKLSGFQDMEFEEFEVLEESTHESK